VISRAGRPARRPDLKKPTNPVSQTVNGVTSINQNLIAVTISVSYTKAGWPARTYNVNSLISSYH
jgi:hypothetical protein